MTIHPARPTDAAALRPQQRADSAAASGSALADSAGGDSVRTDSVRADSVRADSAAYDTAWSESRAEVPRSTSDRFESAMTADGKIYVVVAVVLIIWLGLLAFLFRTDRRIERLERRLDPDISEGESPDEAGMSG
jgi:CcmD family protein